MAAERNLYKNPHLCTQWGQWDPTPVGDSVWGRGQKKPPSLPVLSSAKGLRYIFPGPLGWPQRLSPVFYILAVDPKKEDSRENCLTEINLFQKYKCDWDLDRVGSGSRGRGYHGGWLWLPWGQGESCLVVPPSPRPGVLAALLWVLGMPWENFRMRALNASR